VSTTDWRTEAPIADDVSFLADAAISGVKKFAADNCFDLDGWDITLSKFAYHPVDSSSRTTQIAAYNALASVMATWHSAHIRPMET
jgi:hypothetical protein